MKWKHEGVQKQWEKYKYVILVALVGVALLAWPESSRKESPTPARESGLETEEFQKELEQILGRISGVGQVQVLLTADTDGRRLLAQDLEVDYRGKEQMPESCMRRSKTILKGGTGGDEPIVTQTVYPSFRGALVVCQGGDRAEVRLAVIDAVAALTGLGSDRISVAKWQ